MKRARNRSKEREGQRRRERYLRWAVPIDVRKKSGDTIIVM